MVVLFFLSFFSPSAGIPGGACPVGLNRESPSPRASAGTWVDNSLPSSIASENKAMEKLELCHTRNNKHRLINANKHNALAFIYLYINKVVTQDFLLLIKP